MWRTVIVTKGEKLTLRDNWLVVYSEHTEQRVPLGDIYSVVIDNRAALVSVSLMAALDEANIHVIFCDSKHTVTEKQYDSMKLLVGERLKTENLLDKKDIIEL
jgi:CRISPR/Cas system-associated endonuclease Cas1